VVNDITEHLALPLPSGGNDLSEDVYRLRDALSMLDAAVFAKAGQAEINASLAAIVDSAPDALNSLRELAQSLGNNPDFAGYVATQIANINGLISALQGAVTANSNGLAAKADLDAFNGEVTSRTTADTALNKRINVERQQSRFRSAK
jgi:hypothetical protein